MNLMARQEIQKLLSQTGHSLTIDDFDVICKLDELAELVTNPKGDSSSFPKSPVRLCKYLISSPTISITQWYNECAVEWWGSSGFCDLALGYSLQVTITSDWLWQQDKKTLEREIRKFARGLDCTPAEYEEVIKSVLPSVEDNGDDDKDSSYGPLISLLCKEYSGSPDYWIKEAKIDTIQALVDSYMDGIEAEYKQMKKASKNATLPPFKTPKMAALENFRKQYQMVEQAWLARN